MITVNLDKARVISHNVRRTARTIEMRPHDDIIAKQIPGQTQAAETARQALRVKYAELQTRIDKCKTVDELRTVISDVYELTQTA